jgi:hypothetical protein
VRVRAQPSGELFETVRTTGYQHDLIAAPGKFPGELLADA